jgi:hypothetical protein
MVRDGMLQRVAPGVYGVPESPSHIGSLEGGA